MNHFFPVLSPARLNDECTGRSERANKVSHFALASSSPRVLGSKKNAKQNKIKIKRAVNSLR